MNKVFHFHNEISDMIENNYSDIKKSFNLKEIPNEMNRSGFLYQLYL